MIGAQVGQHRIFVTVDVRNGDTVEITIGASEDRSGLLFEGKRRELLLLEQFGQTRTAIEQLLRRRVKVRTELSERRHFAVLRKLELDRARNLLHRLGLSSRTNAAHRQTNVNRGADALEEQVGFKEDLAVGDRNHVGRNIGRNVASLRFDDRQCRQRTTAIGVGHLRGTLKQAAVEIEDVARIGFAARRTTQKQRHLAIGHSLLRQIVINDDGVHAVVTEIFTHRNAGIRREILERCRLRSGCGNDDRIFHRALLFECADDLRNGRTLLADGDVDAIQLLRFVGALVDFLLVDEGVDGDGGLAGLTVTDDQFALATANWDECVECLEAGLHRLRNRLARDDAGCLDLNAAALCGLERTLAINWVTKAVNNAAKQFLADGNVHNRAGTLYNVAFADFAVGTEDNHTDIVGFEVQRHALNAVGKFDHFTGLNIVEAVDTGDTVTDRQHAADFRNLGFGAEIGDLVLDDLGNFCGADVHFATQPFIALARVFKRVLIEVSIIWLPIFTVSPPNSDGSTLVWMATSLPTRAFNFAESAFICAALNAWAEVTSAVTSPRCDAASAENARATATVSPKRRFCASTPSVLAVSASSFIDFATAAIAFLASARVRTGLVVSDFRSADSPIACATPDRLFSTASIAFASRASSNKAVA